jgi:hypothetical protein
VMGHPGNTYCRWCTMSDTRDALQHSVHDEIGRWLQARLALGIPETPVGCDHAAILRHVWVHIPSMQRILYGRLCFIRWLRFVALSSAAMEVTDRTAVYSKLEL